LIGHNLLYQAWTERGLEVEVEVEVNLRPTVSRPVRPGVRRPSGTLDQFFLRHEKKRSCIYTYVYIVCIQDFGHIA
jgi:hypothetical protein